MLNPDLMELEMTNVFIVIADKQDKSYLSKFYRKVIELQDKEYVNGLDIKKELRESLPNDFIFEGGIANYVKDTSPIRGSEKELMTRRVNTLVLSALNNPDCPIPKSEIKSQPWFKDFLCDLDKIYEMKLIDYQTELLKHIPSLLIIYSPTQIKDYLTTALNEEEKKIKLMDIPSLKRDYFSLRDALQITLALDKRDLSPILTKKQIKDLLKVGFIQADIAIEVCVNQYFQHNNSPSDNPLGIFIHSLQHYYHHPMTDKSFFEEELGELLESVRKESLPLLNKVEVEYIKEFLIKTIEKLK